MSAETSPARPCCCGCEKGEGFGELLKYTLAGYAAGLGSALLLDRMGLQRSGLGQAVVRALSGESESLLEGYYSFRKRLAGSAGSMSEAYGWGKLAGMAAPWVIDGISRLLGADVYGVQGFYIPYFYALSDQIGGSVSGFAYLRRETGSWGEAAGRYVRHPVMAASLLIILLVPIGLLAARLLGFVPSTQVRTSLETIAANLCWVPPLVGWFTERKERAAAGT